MARETHRRHKPEDPGPPGELVAAKADTKAAKVLFEGAGEIKVVRICKPGKLPALRIDLTPK